MNKTGAVLPSSIGWSFANAPTVDGETSALLSNPFATSDNVVNGVISFSGSPSPHMKRRVSDAMENESDDDDNQHQSPHRHGQHYQHSPSSNQHTPLSLSKHNHGHSLLSPASQRPRSASRVAKRARVQPQAINEFQSGGSSPIKRTPLRMKRVLESLDRKGLQDIIERLCESHGSELENEVTLLAPKVTVNLALDNLKVRFQQICENFPYKGNQHGDYAYYRVQPFLQEFFSAFVDYTVHFLPPNETQVSNSLSFLDGATELLAKIPDWENPLHNHAKMGMLDELNSAWLVALKEASKRFNGLGLYFQGGWDQKLETHNRNSNGRLSGALEYLHQEISWANAVDASQMKAQPGLNTSPWVGQS